MIIRLIFTIFLLNMLWLSNSAIASEMEKVWYTQVPISRTPLWPEDKIPPSLCKLNDELISFSCPLYNDKIVSVCTSKNLSPNDGYIAYRYGLPGHIEFNYSAPRNSLTHSFHYTYIWSHTGEQASLSFHEDSYKYTVFYHGFDKGTESISRSGVSVSRNGRTEFQKLCKNGKYYTEFRRPWLNNKGERMMSYGDGFQFIFPTGLNMPADDFTDRIFVGEDVK